MYLHKYHYKLRIIQLLLHSCETNKRKAQFHTTTQKTDYPFSFQRSRIIWKPWKGEKRATRTFHGRATGLLDRRLRFHSVYSVGPENSPAGPTLHRLNHKKLWAISFFCFCFFPWLVLLPRGGTIKKVICGQTPPSETTLQMQFGHWSVRDCQSILCTLTQTTHPPAKLFYFPSTFQYFILHFTWNC